MTDSLRRQWAMLSLLPMLPGKLDAAAIDGQLRAQGTLVSRRTIQRDLVMMSASLPIVCDERSKPYGWSWAKEPASFLGHSVGNGVSPHVAFTLKLALARLHAEIPHQTLEYLRANEHIFDQVLGTGGAPEM